MAGVRLVEEAAQAAARQLKVVDVRQKPISLRDLAGVDALAYLVW